MRNVLRLKDCRYKALILALVLVVGSLIGCSKADSKIVMMKFSDGCEPGNDFEFAIDKETGYIKINTTHYNSLVDMDEHRYKNDTFIKDEEILDKVLRAYEKGILKSKWAYSYCVSLENIEKINADEVLATAEEYKEPEDAWAIIYGYEDLNEDGILTYKEDMMFILNYFLEENDV